MQPGNTEFMAASPSPTPLIIPDRPVVDLRPFTDDLEQSNEAELVATWRELCHWDPMLPPDSAPPFASEMVQATWQALSRPQPLGWGADPQIEKDATEFAKQSGSVEVTIGQLVCLREAFRRHVVIGSTTPEREELEQRLNMIVDRAIAIAATLTAEQLEEQAYVDELTQLFNRRALQRDLRREIGRAARYDRKFGVMVLDLDGLKKINDNEGHGAGDDALRRLADALRGGLRSADAAYRIGGDEFVAVLPETGESPLSVVPERIAAAGAPSFSWGISVYPTDGDDLNQLLAVADARLYEQRQVARHSRLG